MQNTKAEYSNSERTPVVLPEVEQLLPPLSGEQFSASENDIMENGCYAPIIVNEDIVIVDGHKSGKRAISVNSSKVLQPIEPAKSWLRPLVSGSRR